MSILRESLFQHPASGGGILYVKVFNAAGTATQIKTVSVPVPPQNTWVSFESSTFTNSTGQTAFFWVAAEAAIRLVDVQMTIIKNNVQPQLTLKLFLDANNDFVVTNPESDHASYVPGSLPSGLSVTPGPLRLQEAQLVALYVDANNAVFPPPSEETATFQLSETSAFDGMAMNAANPVAWARDDESADFDLRLVQGQQTPGGSTLASAFGDDWTARVWLNVFDFGGFTTATVTHMTVATLPMSIPSDANTNWLPDVGWKFWANGVLLATIPDAFARNQDSDAILSCPVPPGDCTNRDGLVAFEEYRGFMVRGEHRRTDLG